MHDLRVIYPLISPVISLSEGMELYLGRSHIRNRIVPMRSIFHVISNWFATSGRYEKKLLNEDKVSS